MKVITISDPKGRGKPRSRKLPLFGEAERIVLELMELNLGRDFIFCGKDNKKLDPSIPSKIPSLISTDLISEKKISAHFTFSDLRRTCETQLAKLKISKDIRAQVLSHGIGGIQDKHYDRHDYLPEKYDALIKWTMRISEICESHCGDKGGDVEVLSDL